MKSLLTLHLSVLRNVGQICSVDIARDEENITSRYRDEGDSYLTITLPKLAKALERGLDASLWPVQEVAPIWVHHRGLPAFLRGFLNRVFDVDGQLLSSPDTDCIWAVRQLCYLTQKVERPCTPERERAAFTQFVETDASLCGLPGRIDPNRLAAFEKKSIELFGRVFQECDRKIANWELIPKHGPGAVAERLSQKDKRSFQYWPDRIESVFPYWRYTANTPSSVGPERVPISDELPVRVITVPKTQATPRIIAIEPSSVQYAQQGLKREFYELLGRGPLSKVLGFQDQERNRRMARSASISRDMATLDLSEASDRVHWFLVYRMTRKYPHLWDFIWATRSRTADVEGVGVIPLHKFASMGSALTFPIEAMVFTILSVLGVEQAADRRIRVPELPGLVSVYGDDIIVPSYATDHVVDWLEHFGAQVNRTKSFWNGSFRESCGAEYYNGTDVSVVRVRKELPSSRDDAAEIAALVDLRNRAYRAGLWSFTQDVDEALVDLIRLPVSSVTQESSSAYLHRATFLPVTPIPSVWNTDLQRYDKRVPVLLPRAVSYRVDGEVGLLEWFHDALSRGDLVDRYDSQERATSFSIKRRGIALHL